ncbi:cytochrome c-type biogenesis protein [Chitinibacter tainanensis]|uniref:cytochrome c-type biogenesis protein n=1 Tax=Chitinibacter TaxID=230666 RepID=UPI001E38CD13
MATDDPLALNPQVEQRLLGLSGELRCLVCQNESLASSRAPLAEDLRREVRRQIVAGKTDPQILSYLTERYGDFVTYRPPFKGRTVLLWLGPLALLLLMLIFFWRRLRRKSAPLPLPDQAQAQLVALQREFDGDAP